MSERMNYDRLRRVEIEVETLLVDVREQVQRLRTTVDRMRALRGDADAEALGYGLGGPARGGREGPYHDHPGRGTPMGDPR